MALEAGAAVAGAAQAAQAVDPYPVPVVAAAAVALEAQRSAAAMREKRNEMDLASTLVHVREMLAAVEGKRGPLAASPLLPHPFPSTG